MTFPVELRERVVHAVLEGGRAYAEVAGEFGVSEPSFKRWVGKHRRGESLEPKVYKRGLKQIVRTGCAWRMLPREFPPWETVYAAFRSWGRQGTFASMHRELHGLWRERLGRASMPSAVIVDSQSTKTTETGGLAAMTAQRRL